MAISEEFKHSAGKAMGRIPSGVFILTAKHTTDATAMMASWVQQCAFDPPAISVALAKGRPIGEIIKSAQQFAISVVGEEETTLMKRYARGVKPGEDAFAGVETFSTPRGIPALQSAIAWLECRVLTTCDFAGDHELFIAEVTAGQILHPGAAFTHQRGSGFHY